MLRTPNRVTIVAGAAHGQHKLTAFDGALLKAGIGNLNLLRVSSILPPQCVLVPAAASEAGDGQLAIPAGTLTPTAYGAISSDVPGERIAAAVAIGFTAADYGVIMEYSGPGTATEARQRVDAMVREAFDLRGLELADLQGAAADITVADGEAAAAVAAAVFWYA